ncbi:MAG: sn-glycerol-1-phosphate dehydrogenase [Oscillospiraceae bacterium]|nr:sn-glycerol-1-phosphate dehydrogenase [Oscillospiraceae bacterium]
MDINQLLKGVDCTCGRHHACDIGHVYIENNAAARLETLCAPYQHILLVADDNTYEAAGRGCRPYLQDKLADQVIFPGDRLLIPNEDAIDAVNGRMQGIDLIVGVGSGVIQDLCKYVSHQTGVPYFVVATAPSMDGYASSGAAMITGGMKVTYSAGVPDAILADPAVLAKAPMEMIRAGYGDIIGKFSALNDWKLAHVALGEYFCPYIYDLTWDMLQQTLPLAQKLQQRDEDSVKTLMEALVVVGIAMSFAGNSRPASGSEHHYSHFFEITGIVDGEEYLSHGIDVALSTIYTCRMRQKLLAAPLPAEAFKLDRAEYESHVRAVYKSVADECMALQDKLGRYTEDRLSAYKANEQAIRQVLAEAPTGEEIEAILKDVGLDLQLFRDTYSPEKIRNAAHWAKELKDRYTVLWMYYDIFGLEEL